MPTLLPPSSSPSTPAFPSLYLYSVTDAFVKHINLANSQHVEIGRQTNIRTTSAENNGYFDSRFLNRWHAEIWAEDGKIFIKDTRSSNGTFINGKRLSPAKVESRPYELKSNDIIEFGSNSISQNKDLLHDKIVVRVACVLSEQEAVCAASSRKLWQLSNFSSLSSPSLTSPPLSSSGSMAILSYDQYIASSCPSNAASPHVQIGSQIQEHCMIDPEVQKSVPILFRAVKHLASMVVPIAALAKRPAWDLEMFGKILEGDMDILVPEPEELAFLLQCCFPSED